MSAFWKGEYHAVVIFHDSGTYAFYRSMLNLMEGIVPEYDRKGKVRASISTTLLPPESMCR